MYTFYVDGLITLQSFKEECVSRLQQMTQDVGSGERLSEDKLQLIRLTIDRSFNELSNRGMNGNTFDSCSTGDQNNEYLCNFLKMLMDSSKSSSSKMELTEELFCDSDAISTTNVDEIYDEERLRLMKEGMEEEAKLQKEMEEAERLEEERKRRVQLANEALRKQEDVERATAAGSASDASSVNDNEDIDGSKKQIPTYQEAMRYWQRAEHMPLPAPRVDPLTGFKAMFCLVERCRKQNKYFTNHNQVKEHVRHHSDNQEFIPDWALTYMGQERCHICYTKYFTIETNGLWKHASKTHRERRFEFKNRLGLSDTDHLLKKGNEDKDEDDDLEDWDPFADPRKQWVFENDRDSFLKEELHGKTRKKTSKATGKKQQSGEGTFIYTYMRTYIYI